MNKRSAHPDSVPPVACDPEQEVTVDVKKMAAWSSGTAIISAAVAFSIRRTVYEDIKEHSKIHVPVSKELGFAMFSACTAVMLVSAFRRVDSVQHMTRRQFFQATSGVALAAGLGGALGSFAADKVEEQQEALKE
ncbi:MAG TPA: hypothetical protein PKA32_01725 [Candidatus Gracilibacteria bacterium]|nr:hypothetical protein [Candidatus Gracilibacteria bacterium]